MSLHPSLLAVAWLALSLPAATGAADLDLERPGHMEELRAAALLLTDFAASLPREAAARATVGKRGASFIAPFIRTEELGSSAKSLGDDTRVSIQRVLDSPLIANQVFRLGCIFVMVLMWAGIVGCSLQHLQKARREQQQAKGRRPPAPRPGATPGSRTPSGPAGKALPAPAFGQPGSPGGLRQALRRLRDALRRQKEQPSGGFGYPWHTMPSVESFLAVGPTFHTNLLTSLPQALRRRGLRPARPGDVAMVGLWNAPRQRQRALAELSLRDTLANKLALAEHLTRAGLEHLAPPTFTTPAALQQVLRPKVDGSGRPVREPLAKEVREGLWFLKHVGKDNNTGVTCHKGAAALMKAWRSPDLDGERDKYIAQAEVRGPLLFPGVASGLGEAASHKLTVRAYVLVLGSGRIFLHHELLLKGHPAPYDANDPDLLRHVLCHLKCDGVTSARGSQWQHYAVVWPRIGELMTSCFETFDMDVLRDEQINAYDGLPFFWLRSQLATLVQRCRGRLPTPQNADSMKYALLGLDVIVDQELKPWLLELNRSPTLAPEARDPLGTQVKAEVVEDFCELLVDPMLLAAAAAAAEEPPTGPWGALQRWATTSAAAQRAAAAGPGAPTPTAASKRGWVELTAARGD